jgi:ATP-binding cassette subfamily B protein
MKDVSFEDRFGMLVDIEYSNRKANSLKRLIRNASFDQPEAFIADINYTSGRKLNRKLIERLSTCEYITEHRNLFITGATGSGKTSLVNLISRFYDPTEGCVTVDGVDVKAWDLSALRQKIGFVQQKSELFSDTIRGNILWGKEDATDEEIKAAAAVAQAAPFIEGFSENYDTFIAEKGASLSGGQKQRMSITRAMVRKPEILILDDSTSALDLATEGRLRAGLREALKDTTVIMIAQRIASVKEADRIAVIEADGSIIHCAPHDELLRVSETYRDIVSSQRQNGGEA